MIHAQECAFANRLPSGDRLPCDCWKPPTVGCVVSLPSAHRVFMTVLRVTENFAECAWFDDKGALRMGDIRSDILDVEERPELVQLPATWLEPPSVGSTVGLRSNQRSKDHSPSGSMFMTVTEVHSDGFVRCIWIDREGALREADLPSAALLSYSLSEWLRKEPSTHRLDA